MQDNSTIVRRFIEKAVNEGDINSAGQFELSDNLKKSPVDLQPLTTIQERGRFVRMSYLRRRMCATAKGNAE
jgi:hypothetical protein